MYKHANSIFHQAGITPEISFKLDQLSTSYSLAASECGICFITDTVFKYHKYTDDIFIYNLEETAKRMLYVVKKKNRFCSHAMNKFIELSKECINQMNIKTTRFTSGSCRFFVFLRHARCPLRVRFPDALTLKNGAHKSVLRFLAKQNNKDAGDFLKKITSEHIASAFAKKHELFQHEKFKSQHFFIISQNFTKHKCRVLICSGDQTLK